MVLCSWTRHSTFTVHFSAKWIQTAETNHTTMELALPWVSIQWEMEIILRVAKFCWRNKRFLPWWTFITLANRLNPYSNLHCYLEGLVQWWPAYWNLQQIQVYSRVYLYFIYKLQVGALFQLICFCSVFQSVRTSGYVKMELWHSDCKMKNVMLITINYMTYILSKYTFIDSK